MLNDCLRRKFHAFMQIMLVSYDNRNHKYYDAACLYKLCAIISIDIEMATITSAGIATRNRNSIHRRRLRRCRSGLGGILSCGTPTSLGGDVQSPRVRYYKIVLSFITCDERRALYSQDPIRTRRLIADEPANQRLLVSFASCA